MSDLWTFQPYTAGLLFQAKSGIDEDVRWLSPQDKERLGYPTQKPEGLLERVIQASSRPGDVVLDAYCGCGTTVAVAQRLQRQWIGIDITYQSISLILKRLEDSFGKAALDQVKASGIPRDLESARALALRKDDRARKEFEKWAVLTYSNHRAMIQEKKGADQGVDGYAYLYIGKPAGSKKDRYEKILFSVKSGDNVGVAVVRDLRGVLQREKAVMGVLLSLADPTAGMEKEAHGAGFYTHPLSGQKLPVIQIVTIASLLAGERLNALAYTPEVLKKAQARGGENGGLFE